MGHNKLHSDEHAYTGEDPINPDEIGQYGVAELDSNGKVPLTNLPDAIVGAMQYQGTWDASGGSYPTTYDKGYYWVISVAGTIDGKDYEIGDWLVCNQKSPAIWDKIDCSDKVSSVNTKTGAVTLNATDVGAEPSGSVATHASDPDAHHAKSHAHNGADGSGTVAHSSLTGVTEDQHHAKSHALAGSEHTTDTITNLQGKLTDGTLITTKSNEINSLTSKATPVNADILIIEDSESSYAKKKITAQSIIGQSGVSHGPAEIVYSAGGNSVALYIDGTTRIYIGASRTGGGSGTTTFYCYGRLPPEFSSFPSGAIQIVHRRTGTISATISVYRNGTVDATLNSYALSPGTSFGAQSLTPGSTYSEGDEILIVISATLDNTEGYDLAMVSCSFNRKVS